MAAFAPEVLFSIGSFPVTNTVLNTILVDAVLLGGAFYLRDKIKKIPGMFQNTVELLIDGFYNLTESVAGAKNTPKIFPWFMTFFLFILVANWSGLLPGVGSIGLKPAHHAETSTTHEETTQTQESPSTNEHTDSETTSDTSHETSSTADEHVTQPSDDHAVTEPDTTTHEQTASEATPAEETNEEEHLIPIMRNATSELNVTLALAIISLAVTHILSIRTVGFGDYISRFISLNPILLFVGILELVSEFTKIVSLSFRLFGNIFAGEVVLHTISSLFAFGFPVPFMLLEVIVGLVQALVFAMLTMVFMSVLMTPHHAEEEGKH